MFKTSSDLKINFSNDLLEEKQLEGVLTNPLDPRIGIAIFSEYENNHFIIRLYCLLLEPSSNTYNVTHEIEAFSMLSKAEGQSFISRLPNMTAIELLIMMNPIPYVDYQ